LFRKNRVDDDFMKIVKPTSLLVPRDPGRLGTLIYIVTVEA